MGIGDWAQSPIPIKKDINKYYIILYYLKNKDISIYEMKINIIYNIIFID